MVLAMKKGLVLIRGFIWRGLVAFDAGCVL